MTTYAVTYTVVISIPETQPLKNGRPPKHLWDWDPAVMQAIETEVQQYVSSSPPEPQDIEIIDGGEDNVEDPRLPRWRAFPQTEGAARQCVHGNLCWLGHECGLCEMAGMYVWASDDHTCPRCGGGIPNNYARGAYPGAISRWDNKAEICSQCGTQEALIQMASLSIDPRTGVYPWVTP